MAEETAQDDGQGVSVQVPPALVKASIGLIEAVKVLYEMGQEIGRLAEAAEDTPVNRRSFVEIHRAWASMVEPLDEAYVAMMSDELGAIPMTKGNSRIMRDIQAGGGLPIAGVISGGRALVARLVAKLGVARGAEAIARTGVRVEAAAGRAATQVARAAVAAGIPAAARASLAAGIVRVGQLVGLAVGVLVALKIAGSPMARGALTDALPVLALLGAGYWLFTQRKTGE